MIAAIIKEETSKLVRLSKKNLEWIQAIENPSVFVMDGSCPGLFSKKAVKANGETFLQREIYLNEPQWFDMELPICTKPIRHRIDLIGKDKAGHILLELKRKNNPDATSTLTAVLQVLAYYLIIKQNCEALDKSWVHHKASRRLKWKWSDAVEDMRLQVRANKEFWTNQRTGTKYDAVVKSIIDRLKGTIGLELVDEYGEILYTNFQPETMKDIEIISGH